MTSAPGSSTDRILVVDDMPDNCFVLQQILEDEGYQVAVAEDGHTALEMVMSDPPDLLLLDVMMPEMNGFDVTQRLRQQSDLPYIPILLVSAYDEPAPADGFEAGADGFIRKPIKFDDLIARVQLILQPRPTDRLF